jgi:hypothetical protein
VPPAPPIDARTTTSTSTTHTGAAAVMGASLPAVRHPVLPQLWEEEEDEEEEEEEVGQLASHVRLPDHGIVPLRPPHAPGGGGGVGTSDEGSPAIMGTSGAERGSGSSDVVGGLLPPQEAAGLLLADMSPGSPAESDDFSAIMSRLMADIGRGLAAVDVRRPQPGAPQ